MSEILYTAVEVLETEPDTGLNMLARAPKRNRGKNSKTNKHWSQQQKINAVVTFLSNGSETKTANITGIPRNSIHIWRYQTWWKELVEQLKAEEDSKFDVKLTEVIDKSIEIVEDRLKDGNYQFDPKTLKLVRVPVNLRDTARVTTDLIDRREKLRAKPVKAEIEKTVNDHLAKLAEEFKRFASAKTIEGEVLGKDHEG